MPDDNLDEWRLRNDRYERERQARQDEIQEQSLKDWTALYAQMTTPIERAVMELHQPAFGYCEACGRYSDDTSVEWPDCFTTAAIQRAIQNGATDA